MVDPNIHKLIDRIHSGELISHRKMANQLAELLGDTHRPTDDAVWAMLTTIKPRLCSMNKTDLEVAYRAVSTHFPDMRSWFIEAACDNQVTLPEFHGAIMVRVDPSQESYRKCVNILKQKKEKDLLVKMNALLGVNAIKQAMENDFRLLDNITQTQGWEKLLIKHPSSSNKLGWAAAWATLCSPFQPNFDNQQVPVLDYLLNRGADINAPMVRGNTGHALEIMFERVKGCGKLTTEYRLFKHAIGVLLERGAKWENINIESNPAAMAILSEHPVQVRLKLADVAGISVEEEEAKPKRNPAM